MVASISARYVQRWTAYSTNAMMYAEVYKLARTWMSQRRPSEHLVEPVPMLEVPDAKQFWDLS